MRSRRAKISRPKVVYQGKFFTILEARAVYPSGTVKVFEFCRRSPGSAVLAFDHRGRLLLTREFRENVGNFQWRIPAGRADGRAPRAAAQRELREETGCKAKTLKLFLRSASDHSYIQRASLYIAADLVRDPLPHDEGEEIRVVPTPLEKAYRMAVDGTIVNDFISLGIIRLYHRVQQAGGIRRFLQRL